MNTRWRRIDRLKKYQWWSEVNQENWAFPVLQHHSPKQLAKSARRMQQLVKHLSKNLEKR